MAITSSITWLIEGLSYTDSSDGKTLTENANIEYSSAISTAIDAQKYSLLERGQPHRNIPFLFITNLQYTAMSGQDWNVSVNYSSKPPTDKDKPQQRQSTVKPYLWTYNEVVEYDKLTNVVFKNPAGDPLDPPFEIEKGGLGFEIVQYEKSFKEFYYELIGYINSNQFTLAGVTIPPYCAMLESYDPVPAIDEKGYLYFVVTYRVKILKRKDKDGVYIGFQEETLNQGFNYLDGAVKRKILIKDANNLDIEPNEPQLLDATGAITTTPSYTTRCPRSATSFVQFKFPSKYPIAGGNS